VWGWKIENWLRAQDQANLLTSINNAIDLEGRCLIWTGAMPRKFTVSNMKSTDCTMANLRDHGIGHIVIVKRVVTAPTFRAAVGTGIDGITITTLEAGSTGGAQSRNYSPSAAGAETVVGGATGFIRMHLFELHPGKDPDILQGLADLNVTSSNLNMTGTTDWRAPRMPINRDANNQPITPTTCCVDNYPPSNAAPSIAPI
jgi:hypothetical protein